MEFSYELTPEEWRRASIACLHLGPAWPALKWGRALTTTVAIAGIVGAAACWGATGSWLGVAAGLVVAIGAGVGRVLLADRLRGVREVPPEAIAQGLVVTEEGLVDLIRATGKPELFRWEQITQLVDARWAWMIGVGNDEWLVLPTRVVSNATRASLAEQLTSCTGKTFEPLP